MVRHFVFANAILTARGALLGLVLVGAMVPFMINSQIGVHVSWPVAATVVVVWMLNFLATLAPARRAAAVPPSVAAEVKVAILEVTAALIF